MRLKGERAVNRALNHWLWKHGFETRVKGLDTDFFYYHFSNSIGYGLVRQAEADEEWERLLDELGLEYEIAIFWTSFLHELGHADTWDMLTDEEIEEDEKVKEWLQKEDDSSFAESPHYIYFRLPTELVATQWAVDFINENPKAVMELTEKVAPKLIRFFKRNKLNDD